MRDFKGYEVVKVSASIKEDKLKKAVRNGKITLNSEELKGAKALLLHPLCAKMVKKAQDKGRGVTSMMLSGDDIVRDMELHGDKSVWSFMESMRNKKAYNWVWNDSGSA